MFDSQYYKIWRDMSHNKGRSALVILSIMLGVFAIGLTMGGRTILLREMTTSFLAANPAEFIIGTSKPFDKAFVASVAKRPEVADAYGRRSVSMRLQTGPDQWQDIELYALESSTETRVGKLTIESGDWPPQKGELFIERNGLSMTGAGLGDSVLLEAADGTQRTLQIAGTTHDVIQFPSGLSGTVYGYVDAKTLASFGVWQPYHLNELHVSLANGKLDSDHIDAMLEMVQAHVEENGMEVAYVNRPPTPGQHGAQSVIDSIGLLLVVLGLLTLALATFLIANTMSALMARQVPAIGVMKTVGAGRGQLVGLFLLIPLVYGLIALVLALPLAQLAARGLAGFVLNIVNFDAVDFSFPLWLWGLQIGLGLLVPVGAAVLPIVWTADISVREAIDNMVIKTSNQDGLLSRLFLLVAEGWLRLSRPLIISLQNTFRRRARLIFTLIALTLGSAIYMAVATLQLSTNETLEETAAFWQHDVQLDLQRATRLTTMERTLTALPAVSAIEGWETSGARIVKTAVEESITMGVQAIPIDSTMVLPRVEQGRWLASPQANEMVINADVLRFEPTLQVGDTITLDMEGKKEQWTIVGVAKSQLSGPTLYIPYEQYAREYGRSGRASQIVVTAQPNVSQTELAQSIEKEMRRLNIPVSAITTTETTQDSIRFQFGIVTMLMTIMSVLITAVGGFGLVGTMGMNVLERIREIGVMRAIGADTQAILQIVVAEGLVIGLISWAIGAGLSYPIGRLLSDSIGTTLIESPLTYTFSYQGVGLWLLVVTVLATLASLVPAFRAAKVEVRETLAHV
ncbi:MAG: FtsX-like permease family protein [Chloroflexota bacterium]